MKLYMMYLGKAINRRLVETRKKIIPVLSINEHQINGKNLNRKALIVTFNLVLLRNLLQALYYA